MIEISNIIAIRKGSLLATCDVYIAPWDMEINEVKILEKGANRWLSMPAKETVGSNGERKYTDIINFRKESTRARFRAQVSVAVDAFLEQNPDMEPEALIKEDEPIPF